MKRVLLHRADDIVIHTPHSYSGIMLICPQCRKRCKDVSHISRRVWDLIIFHCERCRIEWAIEPTDDYREPPGRLPRSIDVPEDIPSTYSED